MGEEQLNGPDVFLRLRTLLQSIRSSQRPPYCFDSGGGVICIPITDPKTGGEMARGGSGLRGRGM